jgi:hypothetical protein
MRSRVIFIAAAFASLSWAAQAHAPKVGPNGGQQRDAGSYHVEILPSGNQLRVFLRDHGERSVSTTGFKGTAIFVVNGRPQRIPLTPAGDNVLQGESASPLPAAPTGAVQIMTPTGSTVQAKF